MRWWRPHPASPRRLVRAGSALAALGTAHLAANVALLRSLRPRYDAGPPEPRISLLVPARNEERAIRGCLTALAGQPAAEILVLDDRSDDATAVAARSVPDPRITVLAGRAPPAGSLGKPWACRQLAEAASGDVLVFVDADVTVCPGAVAAIIALMEDLAVDLLSAQPRERAESAAERLVQPLLQWSVLTFLPLRLAERSPRPSLSAACGQLLAVRRAAYERCGGHPPAAVLDDLALARAVKRSGGRITWADGSRVAECRMYDDWAGVRDGYGKSLWSAFGTVPGAAGVTALLTLAYLVPALAMLRGSAAGAVGYLAGVLGRVVSARRTGGRVIDSLAHPIGIMLFDWLTWRSVVLHRRGRLQWRGRPVG